MNEQEEESKRCRVCLQESGEMIHPCKCKGSVGWVHEQCLSKWVLRSRSLRCAVCNTHFTASKVIERDAPDSFKDCDQSLLLRYACRMYAWKILDWQIHGIFVSLVWGLGVPILTYFLFYPLANAFVETYLKPFVTSMVVQGIFPGVVPHHMMYYWLVGFAILFFIALYDLVFCGWREWCLANPDALGIDPATVAEEQENDVQWRRLMRRARDGDEGEEEDDADNESDWETDDEAEEMEEEEEAEGETQGGVDSHAAGALPGHVEREEAVGGGGEGENTGGGAPAAAPQMHRLKPSEVSFIFDVLDRRHKRHGTAGDDNMGNEDLEMNMGALPIKELLGFSGSLLNATAFAAFIIFSVAAQAFALLWVPLQLYELVSELPTSSLFRRWLFSWVSTEVLGLGVIGRLFTRAATTVVSYLVIAGSCAFQWNPSRLLFSFPMAHSCEDSLLCVNSTFNAASAPSHYYVEPQLEWSLSSISDPSLPIPVLVSFLHWFIGFVVVVSAASAAAKLMLGPQSRLTVLSLTSFVRGTSIPMVLFFIGGAVMGLITILTCADYLTASRAPLSIEDADKAWKNLGIATDIGLCAPLYQAGEQLARAESLNPIVMWRSLSVLEQYVSARSSEEEGVCWNLFDVSRCYTALTVEENETQLALLATPPAASKESLVGLDDTVQTLASNESSTSLKVQDFHAINVLNVTSPRKPEVNVSEDSLIRATARFAIRNFGEHATPRMLTWVTVLSRLYLFHDLVLYVCMSIVGHFVLSWCLLNISSMSKRIHANVRWAHFIQVKEIELNNAIPHLTFKYMAAVLTVCFVTVYFFTLLFPRQVLRLLDTVFPDMMPLQLFSESSVVNGVYIHVLIIVTRLLHAMLTVNFPPDAPNARRNVSVTKITEKYHAVLLDRLSTDLSLQDYLRDGNAPPSPTEDFLFPVRLLVFFFAYWTLTVLSLFATILPGVAIAELFSHVSFTAKQFSVEGTSDRFGGIFSAPAAAMRTNVFHLENDSALRMSLHNVLVGWLLLFILLCCYTEIARPVLRKISQHVQIGDARRSVSRFCSMWLLSAQLMIDLHQATDAELAAATQGANPAPTGGMKYYSASIPETVVSVRRTYLLHHRCTSALAELNRAKMVAIAAHADALLRDTADGPVDRTVTNEAVRREATKIKNFENAELFLRNYESSLRNRRANGEVPQLPRSFYSQEALLVALDAFPRLKKLDIVSFFTLWCSFALIFPTALGAGLFYLFCETVVLSSSERFVYQSIDFVCAAWFTGMLTLFFMHLFQRMRIMYVTRVDIHWRYGIVDFSWERTCRGLLLPLFVRIGPVTFVPYALQTVAAPLVLGYSSKVVHMQLLGVHLFFFWCTLVVSISRLINDARRHGDRVVTSGLVPPDGVVHNVTITITIDRSEQENAQQEPLPQVAAQEQSAVDIAALPEGIRAPLLERIANAQAGAGEPNAAAPLVNKVIWKMELNQAQAQAQAQAQPQNAEQPSHLVPPQPPVAARVGLIRGVAELLKTRAIEGVRSMCRPVVDAVMEVYNTALQQAYDSQYVKGVQFHNHEP